ncbi:uncharacterized protein TNCV_1739821 [Trichonephila clavipes]|nr:uncharacterized protein TNCV_1739821 [Trichonephila clavipes]
MDLESEKSGFLYKIKIKGSSRSGTSKTSTPVSDCFRPKITMKEFQKFEQEINVYNQLICNPMPRNPTDVLLSKFSEPLQERKTLFGLAIHQNDHQARRRFVEWAQNEIAVVPDFHKRILFSDEAHFWLNGYINKQNCHIWSEANPQVYVEIPLHPEKLTVWGVLWAGGILLQKR